jgi:DNA-3-methyladenine glycosylase
MAATSRAPRPPAPAERRRLVELLTLPPERAAPALLGQFLLRHERGRWRAARIVETEAYLGERDAAAHAFRGRSARTEPLWGPPGTLYVYLVYGMYHCLNLAVDRAGLPGCVLIRAAEPLEGSGLVADALRGPGRLCRALGLDRRFSGRHLFEPQARLTLCEGPPVARPVVSERIGILKAAELRLRFFDPESAAVSRHR